MIMHKDGSVEGTPLEIMEYQRLRAAKAESTPFKTPWKIVPYDAVKPSKCPNEGRPCYCTGACMGKDTTGTYAYER